MITIGADAKAYPRQHKTPCHDCPWRRNALAGWLGPYTAGQWVRLAHGDGIIECHTRKQPHDNGGWHCAGAAIYRANVCKRAEFVLPADIKRVFSFGEFETYHTKGVPRS